MKLIFKNTNIEVYKTKYKPAPYLLRVDGSDIARFNCASDEDVMEAVPEVIDSITEDIKKNPSEFFDLQYIFDSDLNMQVKTALHFH